MKSTNNGFNILEIVLKNNESDISLSDIIKASGLNRATATRIVLSLKKNGFLTQLKKRGKYSIGPRLIYLNRLMNQKSNIAEIAHPFLVKLSQIVDESVIFFGWDRQRVYFLGEVYTKHPYKIIPDPGSSLPMHCTSAGKIFLAQMTDKELDEYLKKIDLSPFTPNSITDINNLKKHLKKVSEEGLAFDNEEHYLGIRSISAGIKDTDGKITFCMAVLGPTVRLTRERLVEIMPDVKYYAMEISERIGFRHKNS